MIRKGLILKIFDAAYMQRWNDKLRPIELTELDKQAHKMFIAYFLGKYEEGSDGFSWEKIILGCFFDLLQRIVITDIKPSVLAKIKADDERYKKLNRHMLNKLEVYLKPPKLYSEFKNYINNNRDDEDINNKILSAAHHYATKWEFDNILYRANPEGHEMSDIKSSLIERVERYNDELEGMTKLRANDRYKSFINMCGELRFQSRWSHLHRIPKTSVLGHSYFVAILAFLYSREKKFCTNRIYNNFFTGLFHDLPEVLTRDIISPVKKETDLDAFLKEVERELMEEKIYPLLPEEFHEEIKLFTENEYLNIISGRAHEGDIGAHLNRNELNPRDGRLVKALDVLSAFIEAKAAVLNGCISIDYYRVIVNYIDKNTENLKDNIICGINFGELYADFY